MNIWTLNIAGRLPMLRVRQFISNPAYFWYFIKRFFWYKNISHNFISKYRDFCFLSPAQTIDELLAKDLSIARFSDGELDLLTGMGVFDPNMSWSQVYSRELAERLRLAMTTENKKIIIAHTSPFKFLCTKEEAKERGVSYTMWTDTRMHLYKFLSPGRCYGDAHSFIPKDNPQISWNRIKEYLQKRNVIIVTGGVDSLEHLSLGKKTYFIEAGKHDAFARYDVIINLIKKAFIDNNLQKDSTLVMLSLGPTASVMSCELAEDGYHVWDSGHIFKYATKELE